jgi:hypothetical protein
MLRLAATGSVLAEKEDGRGGGSTGAPADGDIPTRRIG